VLGCPGRESEIFNMGGGKLQFSPGDVVQSRSGGPSMTVREATSETVVVDWFEGTTLHQQDFPAESLKFGK
jgi:uncharacterized protein YodC (DUF2158 family)